MNLNYSVYVFMLLYSNNSLVVANEDVRIYSIDDKVSGCSTWLSTIIFLFCNNTYKIVKRDTTSMMIEKMSPKDLRLRTDRRQLFNKNQKRVRRQVADECCNRPCTVADVIMYCPNDAKIVQERPDIFD